VTARCGDIEGQAQIRVTAKPPIGPDGGRGGGKGGGTELQKKVIRWSGTIPPQKWTTFYMKVVSPFAAAAGLSLRVEVELPADGNDQQAKAQMEKIRNALRDLGLDDSVDIS
jgi:hypothetical protein